MSNIFDIQGVSKSYGKEPLILNALSNVNFTVKKSDFIAIVGPSGSGKSTLLNILGGLDSPTKGSVFLQEQNLYYLNSKELSEIRRDKIGFVFQSYNLIPVLTVFENLEYVLILQKLKKKERESRIVSMIDKFGLKDKLNKKPFELSGGQQQRVSVARALVSKPSVILADEPTANLDSINAKKLMEIIQEINNTAETTFIFSTHDSEIMHYAKRIIYMKDGLIVNDESKK